MIKKVFPLVLVLAGILQGFASAQITVDFGQGNGLIDFQDLTSVSGSNTVDLSSYNSGASRYGHNFDSEFTLVDLRIATPTGTTAGTKLNTGVNGLGVGGNAGNADKATFDAFQDDGEDSFGDSIVFNLSVEDFDNGFIILDKFVFNDLGSNEFFTLQSDGFKGKNYSGNGVDIDFTESTGTFTFYGSDTSSGDTVFELTDETNTDWYDPVSPQSVYISENDNLSLAFGYANPTVPGANAGNAATLKSFTFHAVPEPASMGLLAVSGIGFVVYRRRKKKVNKKEAA